MERTERMNQEQELRKVYLYMMADLRNDLEFLENDARNLPLTRRIKILIPKGLFEIYTGTIGINEENFTVFGYPGEIADHVERYEIIIEGRNYNV